MSWVAFSFFCYHGEFSSDLVKILGFGIFVSPGLLARKAPEDKLFLCYLSG